MFVVVVAATVFSTITLTVYRFGDAATDFKLKSVDVKMYGVSDYKKAKGVIVVFMFNHCPFAKKKHEEKLMI